VPVACIVVDRRDLGAGSSHHLTGLEKSVSDGELAKIEPILMGYMEIGTSLPHSEGIKLAILATEGKRFNS
jgi:hypothetical protein